jgi:mono/diheme cytochrome c family protein
MTVLRGTFVLFLLLPVIFVRAQNGALLAQGPAATASAAHREVIDKYCVTCHNDRARTGGLSLNGVDVENVGGHAEIWEKVLHKLRTGQMPPAGAPRPDEAVVTRMASWLETSLDRDAAAKPNPGRIGAHRLNRSEYANAIRDLFALEVDTKSLLLPDEADEGFDNVAASLTLSPAHVERYLSTARRITRLAVGDPTLGAVPGFELYQIPKMLVQDRRISQDLPFGSHGGFAIRHYFKLDGEYAVKLRLRRQIYDYIIGMGHPHQLDVRIDGKLVKRFTIGGEGTGTPGPLTWNGEIVGDTEWEMYMHSADANLQVRFPVKAGHRVVGISFVDPLWEAEGVPQPPQTGFGRGADEQYDGYPAVDTVAIGGPYVVNGSGDTPSRRAIFVCRPASKAQETTCARKILSAVARRAYRRPVTEDEVQTLLRFYANGRAKGNFEAGVRSGLERILVSFNFLYRIEKDPPNAIPDKAYRLSDLELASRLSFFLWSSIPDNELLDLAIRGRLRQPAVLEQQVRRMLSDRRSRALVENFAGQWLDVRKIRALQPDPTRFPDFDENLREAFLQETELFINSQLSEDAGILELLTANYTFMNERLARHYGVSGVYGERFRRVSFDDGVRGGLLGQGSVLMVTSYPDRTSPVLRGKWVLENVLGMPPPPPPPDVPELESKDKDGKALSIRAQMEQHRKNPACAVCHVRMDPLGFALENFDAVGQWRKVADGFPVDVSAEFFDGTRFDGIQGLRQLLLSHRSNFVDTFTAKLLTYAIGRGIDYNDYPAVRRITRKAAEADYRWSAVILGVVNSTPFQMRRAGS